MPVFSRRRFTRPKSVRRKKLLLQHETKRIQNNKQCPPGCGTGSVDLSHEEDLKAVGERHLLLQCTPSQTLGRSLTAVEGCDDVENLEAVQEASEPLKLTPLINRLKRQLINNRNAAKRDKRVLQKKALKWEIEDLDSMEPQCQTVPDEVEMCG